LYPGAVITAMTPPGYPRDALTGLADRLVETAQRRYSPKQPGTLRALLRQIQAGRYDLFVVMFDSPRLRLLSALTGVRKRYCYTADGRYYRLTLSVASLLVKTIYRNIRGRITYARIRYIVYHHPVPPPKG
jgi:ADP-heptose:LPS heptosyltransferase